MGQLSGYADHIDENLSKVLGFDMHLVQMRWEVIPDSGVFDAMRNTDEQFVLMGKVKGVVAAAARIAQDLMVFGSGPARRDRRTDACGDRFRKYWATQVRPPTTRAK